MCRSVSRTVGRNADVPFSLPSKRGPGGGLILIILPILSILSLTISPLLTISCSSFLSGISPSDVSPASSVFPAGLAAGEDSNQSSGTPSGDIPILITSTTRVAVNSTRTVSLVESWGEIYAVYTYDPRGVDDRFLAGWLHNYSAIAYSELNALGAVDFCSVLPRKDVPGIIAVGCTATGGMIVIFFNRTASPITIIKPAYNSTESLKPCASGYIDNLLVVVGNRVHGQNKTLSLVMICPGHEGHEMYVGDILPGHAREVNIIAVEDTNTSNNTPDNNTATNTSSNAFNKSLVISYKGATNSTLHVVEVKLLGIHPYNNTTGQGQNGGGGGGSGIYSGEVGLSVSTLFSTQTSCGDFRLGPPDYGGEGTDIGGERGGTLAYLLYVKEGRIRLRLLKGSLPFINAFNTGYFKKTGLDEWECLGDYYATAIEASLFWKNTLLVVGQASISYNGVKFPAFWQFSSLGSGVYIMKSLGDNASSKNRQDYYCLLEHEGCLLAGGKEMNVTTGNSSAIISHIDISLFGTVRHAEEAGEERGVYIVEHPVLVLFIAGSFFAVIYAFLVVATERLRYSFFFLLAPLYSRVSKENAQDNFTRGQILGYLKANPGVNYRKLKEALNLGNGNLTYHLRVLEKQGLIRSRNKGLKKYFFPADIPLGSEILILSETQRFILAYLKNHPMSSLTVLADVTGVSVAYCGRQVKELEEAGVVRVVVRGPNKLCYIAEQFFEAIKNTEVPRAIRLDSRFSHGKPII